MEQPTTAAQRVAAQQRQMQGKVIQCKRCGGSYFKNIKVMRYTQGYGSVETQPDATSQEFELIECICGFPVAPLVPAGRKAMGVYEGAHKEMRESVAFAQDSIKELDPKTILKEVVNMAAGKHEVGLLAERLLKVEETILTPLHATEVEEVKAKNKTKAVTKEKETNE